VVIEEALQDQLGNVALIPKDKKIMMLKYKPDLLVDKVLAFLKKTPASDPAVKGLMFNLKTCLRVRTTLLSPAGANHPESHSLLSSSFLCAGRVVLTGRGVC